MRVIHSPNRVPILLAFLSSLGLGFAVAVLVRDAVTGRAQADPCWGAGTLVSSRWVEVTQQEIDRAVASHPRLQEAVARGEEIKPGLREFRECRTGPLTSVTIDAQTGAVVSLHTPSLAELEAYYNQHPEELPSEKAEESFQKLFVSSDLPPEIMEACDPGWTATTSKVAQAAACHPPSWSVLREDEVSVLLGPGPEGSGPLEVGVVAPSRASLIKLCASPQYITTRQGNVGACAMAPDYWGQHYDLILPSGRYVVVNIYKGATAEEKATALRVAVNVEALP